MKLMKQTILASALAACFATSAFAAGETTIRITPRVTAQPAAQVSIRQTHDFAAQLSFKVKTDPTRIPKDRLIEIVNSIEMRDGLGLKITSGFDIHPQADLVLGFSGGTAEIVKVASRPGGLQIVGAFKNANGQSVSPPPSQLALYTTGGQKLCFDYHDVEVAGPPVSVVMLLDRSGSMKDVIDAVGSTSRQFLSAMPANAQCAVASFNASWSYHARGFAACNATTLDESKLAPSGKTDLYSPLSSIYERLNQPAYDQHQKAVIIITDGIVSDQPEEARARKAELLSQKDDVLTFVYWLGDHTEEHLQGLADSFINTSGSVAQDLGQYLSALGSAYQTQRVLNVRACNQVASNANP